MATSRRLFRQAASSSSSDTTRRLTVLLLKLVPHNCSVTAFTLRVLTPSTYICIKALTSAFSDRWYRSNNSVWNVPSLSCGTSNSSVPTRVFNCRGLYPLRYPRRSFERTCANTPRCSGISASRNSCELARSNSFRKPSSSSASCSSPASRLSSETAIVSPSTEGLVSTSHPGGTMAFPSTTTDSDSSRNYGCFGTLSSVLMVTRSSPPNFAMIQASCPNHARPTPPRVRLDVALTRHYDVALHL